MLLLGLGSLVLYLAGAGGYDLLTDDEMRYAEAGRRMLSTGDWIIPEYNGLPRYQKPILFYWLQACFQGLFGSTVWAARLPSALAGTMLVLLVANLGRKLWGDAAGLWSGIVLAVMAEFVLLSRLVMTDIVLLLCLQAALGCFLMAQGDHPLARQTEAGSHSRQVPDRADLYYLIMYLAMGLGVLTKGPVAVALPAAILAPWLLARGEGTAALRRLRLGWGLILLAGVAGPWYLAAHILSGGEFTRHFFLTENLGRFTSNINPHPAPPLLYFVILLPSLMPWTGLLPLAVRAVFRTSWRSGRMAEAAPWLVLWQGVLVFTVFTLSGTRVWTYTAPILPAAALLIGRWIALHCPSRHGPARPLRPVLWSYLAAALLLATAAWLWPLAWLPEPIRDARLLELLRWLCLGLLAAAAALLVVESLLGSKAAVVGLGITAVGLYFFAVFAVVPRLDFLLREPVRQAARLIRQRPGAMIVTCHVHELGLNWLTGQRRVLHWRTHTRDDLHQLLEGDIPIFLLISPHRLPEYQGLRLHEWYRSRHFVLAANVPPDNPASDADDPSQTEGIALVRKGPAP
jgi:4-amino-4-deoxy-L-arabinose transferase-like glycosyltransferase